MKSALAEIERTASAENQRTTSSEAILLAASSVIGEIDGTHNG